MAKSPTQPCGASHASACARPRLMSGQECTESGDMKFCVTNYPNEALKIMGLMKCNETLCDVKLLVGDETYYAHKLVLAAASPYFKAMFTGGLRECEMSSVTLQGVCPITMGSLLCFMYTSEIRISDSNVCHLLPAATMFQMSHVIDACCVFLEKQLDPSNAIGIANFAQQYGCMDLYKKCNDFINSHFCQVSHEEEFLQLNACQLVVLVKRDELNVRCEKEVYNAVLRWVKHDDRNRQFKLEHILSVVRCHYLTPDFLNEQIKHCELLNREPKCRDYLLRIFQDLTLHRKPCSKQRKPNAPAVIYVAGGYLRHSLGQMERFNIQEQTWSTMVDLPMPRSGLGAAFIQGLFYAVGGRNNCPEGNQDSNSLDCYDPVTKIWKPCAPMSTARSRIGVSIMDGLLYAVGGCKGPELHRSVERYNPEKDTWEDVEPMAVRRIGVGVAVVNRLLYAVGGFDGTNRLDSAECYHPERKEWITIASMKTRRSAAGVIGLDQYVYAVGGYDGSRQLDTMERYNTETNEWENMAKMKSPRSALSVAVLEGKLYALGGYDGNNFLASVEVYDPATNTWADAPPMHSGRSGHASAVSTTSCPVHVDTHRMACEFPSVEKLASDDQ